MAKKLYKIRGMDCDACAKMIELDLEDAGINASCNFAKETLEVDLDENAKSEKKIKEVVVKGGYQISPE